MNEENSKNISARLYLPIVAVSLLSGMLGAALYGQLNSQSIGLGGIQRVVEERTYVEESQSIEAIKKVVPAVVSIVTTKDLQVFQGNPLAPFFFFEGNGVPQQQSKPELQRQQISGGTGFIVQEDGLTITNRHVVADTEADYTALTKDGKEYDVEVISLDPVNDLAVVQLHEKTLENKDRKTGEKKDFGAKPKGLTTVEMGDSTKLEVGQQVLAIGNARGEYENSVTSGIVSAINRSIEASDMSGGMQQRLSGLIQTDAAINFGNSGGPLINLAGQVIGMNTAIDTSGSNIGFAIPVNQIKPALESVKKNGKIVRPVLGVTHVILTKEKAEELHINGVDYGALITGDRSKKEFGVIPGSPAEKAGLRIDDVILEVDGTKVTTENPLQMQIQSHVPGDTVTLKIQRGESTFDVKVKLGEY